MLKKILKYLILGSASVVAAVLLINLYILQKSEGYIYEIADNVPKSQAALILGAKVNANGKMSDVLMDRSLKALELYKNGKVDKLLVSGDHGREEYDEVGAVKDFLLKEGVAKEDIFLDHAGFDTYDSIYRAREVFQVDSLIIVTQEFHLPRAVYTARALDIEAYGYVADRQEYVKASLFALRESLARVKAFGNVVLGSDPKFLGEPIPIYGDGTLSWD